MKRIVPYKAANILTCWAAIYCYREKFSLYSV